MGKGNKKNDVVKRQQTAWQQTERENRQKEDARSSTQPVQGVALIFSLTLMCKRSDSETLVWYDRCVMFLT